MTPYQQSLFDQIEEIKRALPSAHPAEVPRMKWNMQRLARMMTVQDDREYDLRHGRRNDPGGRSRSPSFGRWKHDDERA